MAGAGAGAGAAQVSFDDVMVRFSEEELGLLEKWQQDLYVEVLTDIYESLIIIGNPVTYSDVIAWWKQGEQQNCTGSQESRAGDSSATDEGLGQMSSPGDTEALEPPTIDDCRAEGEMAQYGRPGGTREDRDGLLLAERSRRREVCMPRLEKATGGLASPAPAQDAAVAQEPYECLRTHREGRAEERPYLCARCGDSFCHYPCFLQHQNSHDKAKAWPCTFCSTTFMYQSDLAPHEESHCDGALGASSKCGQNCLCTPSLRSHFAARPQKSAEEGRTDSQEKLRREGQPNQEKPYTCSQCEEPFGLEENLETHYQYCCQGRLQRDGPRKGGEKRVPDQSVPKPPRKRSRPASPRSPAQWACSVCSASFPSRYGLFKHRQRHHAGERRSNTELDRSVSLTRGFGGRTPVGVTKKLQKCSKCRKWFALKKQLAAHMKSHARENCCPCTFCGESLGYKDHFGKWLRIHPEEQAPPEQQPEGSGGPPVAAEPRGPGGQPLCRCAVCGKSFKKSYFPDHQAWHAGLRFRCSLCGKKSNFYSTAYRHFLRHRKWRDFSTCSVCGAGIQSQRCPCSIKKFYLKQKPPLPAHPQEEMGPPAAAPPSLPPSRG